MIEIGLQVLRDLEFFNKEIFWQSIIKNVSDNNKNVGGKWDKIIEMREWMVSLKTRLSISIHIFLIRRLPRLSVTEM